MNARVPRFTKFLLSDDYVWMLLHKIEQSSAHNRIRILRNAGIRAQDDIMDLTVFMNDIGQGCIQCTGSMIGTSACDTSFHIQQ